MGVISLLVLVPLSTLVGDAMIILKIIQRKLALEELRVIFCTVFLNKRIRKCGWRHENFALRILRLTIGSTREIELSVLYIAVSSLSY